jgi:hypothetical protein
MRRVSASSAFRGRTRPAKWDSGGYFGIGYFGVTQENASHARRI